MPNTEVEKTLEKLNSLLQENISEDYYKLADKWKRANWEDETWYTSFLKNHYHVVQNTEKLICLSASLTDLAFLRIELINDFYNEELKEQMLMHDLDFLGSEASLEEEASESSSLYQRLHYDIEKTCPEAVVGRICALKLMAIDAAPEIYKGVISAMGEGRGEFFKSDLEEGVKSIQKTLEGLEKVLLTKPNARESILNQFKQTCSLYTLYLNGI